MSATQSLLPRTPGPAHLPDGHPSLRRRRTASLEHPKNNVAIQHSSNIQARQFALAPSRMSGSSCRVTSESPNIKPPAKRYSASAAAPISIVVTSFKTGKPGRSLRYCTIEQEQAARRPGRGTCLGYTEAVGTHATASGCGKPQKVLSAEARMDGSVAEFRETVAGTYDGAPQPLNVP
ncbi:hypothetical protein IEO21_06791 [Rhodonia placenta]|uniref:Uncharacterized protein n=1 Tax=Rhodonia placenta TaxID=104341 RepID=A0A8H7U0A5_9APHY|nr:hypothetical protein IEO21_06791 [Postia placenta]